MKVTIIERPRPRRVPASHRTLRPRHRTVLDATVAPWMGTNNLMGRESFGVGLDDPSVTDPRNAAMTPV